MHIPIKNESVVRGVVVAASFGAGAALSYLVTKRTLEAKYESIIQEEINRAREYYKRLNKKEEFSTPQKMVQENLTDYMKEVGKYTPPRKIPARVAPDAEDDPEDVKRVTGDVWDYEAELANRREDRPYIIHHDEFFENSDEYDELSLTYFDGDDVLVDEKDEPVDDPEDLIGEDTLKFGHGSKDHKIVYIRNDRRQAVIEVVENKGYYVREVLGFIEHADDPKRPRKFRRDYE